MTVRSLIIEKFMSFSEFLAFYGYVTFLQLMNTHGRGQGRAVRTRRQYIVDRKYDHTPIELLRLDNYLLDGGVLSIIQGVFKCDDWKGWYHEMLCIVAPAVSCQIW
jgi:hypothetical protein